VPIPAGGSSTLKAEIDELSSAAVSASNPQVIHCFFCRESINVLPGPMS